MPLTITPGLAWALALSVLAFFLCGPFRSLVLRRRIELQEVNIMGADTRVVLIHGTFARGAKWTGFGHAFQNYVQAGLGPCDVYRLLWSGDNFQGARRAAADKLVDWAHTSGSKGTIYLVGHSHGGAIAAMAASRLDGLDVKVIALSTPFIIVQQRRASLLPRRSANLQGVDDSLLLFGVILWLIVGAMALFSLSLASYGAAFALILHVAFGQRPLMTRTLAAGVELLRSHGQKFASAARIEAAPDSLLILRTPGDEASGALAAVHTLAWVLTSALKLIGRMASALVWLEAAAANFERRLRSKSLLAALAFFPAIGLLLIALGLATIYLDVPYSSHLAFVIVSIAVLAPLVSLFLMAHIGYLIVAPALTIAAATVNALLALPFGLDLALRSLLVASSAEPTPFGSWPVRMIASGETLLAHSALYESVTVQYALQAFAEAQPVPGSEGRKQQPSRG